MAASECVPEELFHMLLCVEDLKSPIGSKLCVDSCWTEGAQLMAQGVESGNYRQLEAVSVPRPCLRTPLEPLFLWYPRGLPLNYRPLVREGGCWRWKHAS